MDFSGSARACGDSAIYLHRRRNRDATLERAAAVALRLAADYVLASRWDSRAVPNSLRRNWTARFSSLALPSPDGRTLAAHDSRGTGTIPRRHARALRLWALG